MKKREAIININQNETGRRRGSADQAPRSCGGWIGIRRESRRSLKVRRAQFGKSDLLVAPGDAVRERKGLEKKKVRGERGMAHQAVTEIT